MRVLLPQLCFCLLLVPFWGCSQNKVQHQPIAGTAQEPVIAEASNRLAKATFASGCFWCSEGVFEQLKGVEEVMAGYAGGNEQEPTYKQVSGGLTGHAESIQITYDPAVVSYKELLDVFFASHDPTTLNRQGPDVGAHYRSAIFYRTLQEKQQALEFIKKLNGSGEFKNPVVTEVVPFKAFWVAEGYHQDFYLHNPDNLYMQSVFGPKLKKVKEEFSGKLKEE